jgi:hypothetical protein
MKIHTNTWHYKIFNMFNDYPADFYTGTTDCKYISKIILHLLILIVGVPFATLIALLLLAMAVEPVLVLGNWILGNGFGPVLGLYAQTGYGQYGLLVAGSIIWAFVGVMTLGHHFKKWSDGITYADAPKTSFTAVLYLRLKSWKGKYCQPVEFVDD